MKIQCDVCDKAEASLFCPADEAALCHSCDRTIHRANKLATKHTRFNLHHPSSSKDTPRCDICQERRAYLFCQEDRAILCRECDLPIHRANEHTQKHNRFLLTGVKLSGTCLELDPPAASSSTAAVNNSNASEARIRSSSSSRSSHYCKADEDNTVASDTASVSTSSISQYLIETIPGFCFEDLLDASFAPNGFCKNKDRCSDFQDQDLDDSARVFPLATSWIPQTHSHQFEVEGQSPELSSTSIVSQIGSVVKGITKTNTVQESWKWIERYSIPQLIRNSR